LRDHLALLLPAHAVTDGHERDPVVLGLEGAQRHGPKTEELFAFPRVFIYKYQRFVAARQRHIRDAACVPPKTENHQFFAH